MGKPGNRFDLQRRATWEAGVPWGSGEEATFGAAKGRAAEQGELRTQDRALQSDA